MGARRESAGRGDARQFTAAAGVLLLLALAACDGGMAPPPGSQSPGVVTIASAGDSVVGGDPLRFRVSANPAPPAALTVTVTITAPDCELAQSPESVTTSVTIAAGESHATLTVPSRGVAAGANRCVVTATIAAGDGYEAGAGAGASASATLTMQPVVTVTRDSASVTEGEPVSFTLTAAPVPAVDLAVTVSWWDSGSFLAASVPRMVTIPASESTTALTAATVDDGADEPHGSVTTTVEAGSGYTVGAQEAATVAVTDNDTTSTAPTGPTTPRSRVVPQVTIAARATAVTEGEPVSFTLTADPAPASDLTVNLQWEDPGGFLSGTPPQTATIVPSGTIRVAEATVDDQAGEADGWVTVTVGAGSGYAAAGAGASILVEDNDRSSVSLSVATSWPDDYYSYLIFASVGEGDNISLTLTATPAPAAGLEVKLSWSHTGGDVHPPNPPETVTIPPIGTVSISVATGNDNKDNFSHTNLYLRIKEDARYNRGEPFIAQITIVDDE